jgi:hypothetical protein
VHQPGFFLFSGKFKRRFSLSLQDFYSKNPFLQLFYNWIIFGLPCPLGRSPDADGSIPSAADKAA